MSATRIALSLAASVVFALAASASAQTSKRESALSGTFKAYSDTGVAARMSEFSGLPVPRYSSLKYDDVNGRAGPSTDYPVAWNYHRSGLPVVIVRESEDWRKIRDPQGDEVWVHRRVLAGERTVMTTSLGSIRRTADSRSAPVARFGPGAVLKLLGCTDDWCEVEGEGRKGHVARAQLWGAADLPPAE